MVQPCSWLHFEQEVGQDDFLKSRSKSESYEPMNIQIFTKLCILCVCLPSVCHFFPAAFSSLFSKCGLVHAVLKIKTLNKIMFGNSNYAVFSKNI